MREEENYIEIDNYDEIINIAKFLDIFQREGNESFINLSIPEEVYILYLKWQSKEENP